MCCGSVRERDEEQLTWELWSVLSRFTPSQQDGKYVSALIRSHGDVGRLLVLPLPLPSDVKHTC